MQDSILFWNGVALEANRVSHSDPDKRQQNGPTLSSRALAIVHLAMYDAFAGVVGGAGFPRYLTAPPPPPAVGASARDAVAGAAHTTLTALYSAQAEFFTAQLSAFDVNDPSFAFGRTVGRTLLALRANDMDARDCGYGTSNNRGRHRLDPDNPGQGFHAPYYGAQTRGFAISARHTLARPPFANGTDPKYLLALRDVRAKGISNVRAATLPGSLFDNRRSPLDTLIGTYWAYDGANRLGTPPRLYNQIIRQVAVQRGNNEGQNARLFALVNAAMGDAGILAWEQKYCHDFWRPVVGIREHDETLGPAAPYGVNVTFSDADPGWLPLGGPSTNSPGMKNFTPNFPAYPSGHATFGAAAFHTTRMFYGVAPNNKSNDNLFPGVFISDEFNGGNRDNDGTVRPRHTRSFPGGLWQMILENAISRVLLGVHWIFDAFDFRKDNNGALVPDLANENIGGVGLGLRIARDVFAFGNGLAPKMTPNNAAVPPIITPVANSPMPTVAAQPASVGGCANTLALGAIAPSAGSTSAAKSSKNEKKGRVKKEVARSSGRKGAHKGALPAETAEQDQAGWPSVISQQDQAQPDYAVQGPWPAGISEK
jgi:membrane-associated phospholipid phosphatase